MLFDAIIQTFPASYRVLQDCIGDISLRALQIVFLPVGPVNMLPPHLRRGPNRPHLRRPAPPLQASEQSAESTEPSLEPHFPRTPQDVSAVLDTLRQASAGRLTDELLKPILFHADYDCVHFAVTSTKQSSRHSSGPTTLPEPYIETDALMWLGDFDVLNDDGSLQSFNGRIRSIQIEAIGRDQGWVGNRDGGAWSWFELGKTQADSGQQERKGWKWNMIGNMKWQHHNTTHHMDEELSETDHDLSAWLSTLRNGDRLSLIPMARFSSWSCNVSKGKIDIEIEVWR
ncbi:uncharacterized protein MYCFIDRAFT_75996 [Pseudocercospora fijiensis CIRAD86]|uniref:Uncharacterized protein n=1 Tax=Pseudocercospora fijiensis (strain CIRAD86) TaxID=383855 RepID=N1QAV5_PSEFD|nr:uncharacterized protein MYCFIDRAFT_75996 [Pseudocercospora fijiensis CIRAD86]EME88162.1 hypothetical protein MYCFIDRAFT_75996 [Pseudocercospora fijiensis CIRAD86]